MRCCRFFKRAASFEQPVDLIVQRFRAGALGAAVVFGMAMNTLLATVYIPNFYELMQKLQEKFSKKKGNNDKQEGSM